jgi:hypothetical protein
MSKLNAHGFVVQEVLYSPDLRRTCSVCGANFLFVLKIYYTTKKSLEGL